MSIFTAFRRARAGLQSVDFVSREALAACPDIRGALVFTAEM